MAGSASTIQELRTSLERSRWQLHDGLSRLEDRLQQTEAARPLPLVNEPPDCPPPLAASIPGLREGQAARIMFVALMAGLAAGLSWSRWQR